MTIDLECAAPGARPGERSTSITIEAGVRNRLALRTASNAAVLIDRRVLELYPDLVAAPTIAIDAGEDAKSFATLEGVIRELARAGFDRGTTLTVVGGGSVGDLGGLAAAMYLRGIECVQVPTTLLAMVDSSVGGKTAINIPEGKNLVGAFAAPARVWIDPEFVATLDETEFRSGLGEVLKIAIGLDAELFEHCERARDAILAREPLALELAIGAAVRAKIEVVERDFRETGPRRLLNLGHTLGHALEAASGFSIPHGIAVARGIHYALDVAEREGQLAAADAARCRALLQSYGFAPDPLPAQDALEPFIARDKKRCGDGIDFVIPTGIGRSAVRRMSLAALRESMR